MFLILGDFIFNLSEVRCAYKDSRDGQLCLQYKNGDEFGYALPFDTFANAIKEMEIKK